MLGVAKINRAPLFDKGYFRNGCRVRAKIVIVFLLLALCYTTTGMVTRGIFVERFVRYLPILETTTSEGSFVPMIDFISVKNQRNRHTTFLPFLLYYIPDTLEDLIKITTADTTTSRGYDRFAYVRFTNFRVHFASGREQIIISEGSGLSSRKFKVCNGSYASCGMTYSDWVEASELEEIGPLTVIVEGVATFTNGQDEPFSFSQQWKIDDRYKFTTLWGYLPLRVNEHESRGRNT